MVLDLTDDKSTLVQVMAWCRQATSHYLSRCWPRSLSPYGVTRPQWVKASKFWLTQYSVSPIYRGRIYRGIGYIAVACWTPFFCPPISRILQTWRPRARYFSRNRGNSLHSIRGRQFFAKSAHRDSLCSCSLETIFSRNQLEPTCQCGLEHMLCDGQPC